MGAYVNLNGICKLEWLKKEGVEITKSEAIEHKPGDFDSFVVCLVDNVNFYAAGIMFSIAERSAFTEERDKREKQFFLVSKEKLLKVSDLKEYLRE
jgi:hypothetical protein